MKLVLAEPRFMKDPISVISALVNEVKLKINKDGIELIAIDPGTIAMIDFKLLSSSFVEYDVKKEHVIGISLESLNQMLRRAKPSDTLIIELDEEKNKLQLQLKGEAARTFNLPLIEIDSEDRKIRDLDFAAKIELNSFVFDEAIEDMDIISDSVAFIAEPKKFTIQANGTLNEGKVEIEGDEETTIVVDGTAPVRAKYSMEYLKKIISGSKLSDRVYVSFSKENPLKIEYKVLDKLQLATILAPRVETD